jgi:hypothetical protein
MQNKEELEQICKDLGEMVIIEDLPRLYLLYYKGKSLVLTKLDYNKKDAERKIKELITSAKRAIY